MTVKTFLLKSMINKITVASAPLNVYIDRARRILRLEENLTIIGQGNNIANACTLVEILRRQKIAKIAKVATSIESAPFFNNRRDPTWSPPTSTITIHLKRGEFALFITDYHQRKIIELFESRDKLNLGYLSLDQVNALNIGQAFYATAQKIEESKKYLNNFNEEKRLNLPEFIKYASILIHPLLKDRVFKQVLKENYAIASIDRPPQQQD